MLLRFRMLKQAVIVLVLASILNACGGSSSSTNSTTETTTSTTATVFYAHNLVFKNTTTLSTGYNAYGQLGDRNLVNRSIPGKIAYHIPFTGFATGADHSVAFVNNSTVRCWGYNTSGQLGDDTTKNSSVPKKVTGLSGVIAVAAGAFHTLALRNDDTLWAWGGNSAGQLGVNTSSTTVGHSKVPMQVGSETAGFANISSIAANGKHSLAIAAGKVWGWGLNGNGQLGQSSSSFGKATSPVVIDNLPAVGIAMVAAGGSSSYAVAKDGTLWAWGYNYNGQLGNNSTTSSYLPVQVLKAPGAPLTGVVKVAAGIQHGLALLADGTVWAWGYNHYGQLGNNNTPDSSVAQKVYGIDGATDIRAFGSSSMAKVGDSWYVWGDNSYGQLGIGTTVNVSLPVKMFGF